MKRIYLLVAAVIALASCKKEEVAPPPPPPPTPGPVITSVKADTTTYGGSLTVTWSASATGMTMNGTSVPVSGSKTFTNMVKDTTLVFIATRNGKTSEPMSVKGIVRSQKYTWIAGGPVSQYPKGVKWKNVRKRHFSNASGAWTDVAIPCEEFSFNAKGEWFLWAGSCTDGTTDGNGSNGWDLDQGDQRFRWGTTIYSVVSITEDSMVIKEVQETGVWELTWERI